MEKNTILFFRRSYNTGQHNLLKNSESIVYASLGDTPNPAIQKHNFHSDPMKVNFDQGSSQQTFDSKLAHGVFMVCSWVTLSLGVLFARYLKGVGKDFWFQTHRAAQVIGTIGSFIGLTIIIIFVVTTSSNPFNSFHPILGFIIHFVLIIHFIWACVRPHINKDKSKSAIRKIWELIHHNTGRLLILGAFINIPLGICKYFNGIDVDLGQCFSSSLAQPYLIAHFIFVGVYVIFVVVGEICRCSRKKYMEIQ